LKHGIVGWRSTTPSGGLLDILEIISQPGINGIRPFSQAAVPILQKYFASYLLHA